MEAQEELSLTSFQLEDPDQISTMRFVTGNDGKIIKMTGGSTQLIP